MSSTKLFEAAFPYADDILALPVEDIDQASIWYRDAFGLNEVERRADPAPAVILERDGIRIGFAVNGGDPGNEGAAILVTDIHRARQELEANGIEIGNWRVDENDGQKFQVFFRHRPGWSLLLLPPAHRGDGEPSDE